MGFFSFYVPENIQVLQKRKGLGEGFPKKVAVILDFVQITSTPSPSPQFGQLVQLFLNAKNADLSDI